MNREMARKILGENATEEQITNLLNEWHIQESSKIKELENQVNDLSKEAETNLKNSRIIVNNAKAKEILAGYDLDDEIFSMLVSDDETTTINRANKLKEKFDIQKQFVETKTKEQLSTLDLTPSISNVQQNDLMTMDKFLDLSAEEQDKFMNEHPTEFNNLK